MVIEDDETFEALCRERYAKYAIPKDIEDQQIDGLVAKHRLIREAIADPGRHSYDMSADEWMEAMARWALWYVETRECGAMPTEAHRIYEAVRTAVMWTRQHERERISDLLMKDNAAVIGPTAQELIAEAIERDIRAND